MQLIIRAHECVMDGFERFAHGQLITLFSATNYCGIPNPFASLLGCAELTTMALYNIVRFVTGSANNAGAILVIGRGLVVVPKLIHPLPPAAHSPEASPEHVIDETWMQVRFVSSTFISLHFV